MKLANKIRPYIEIAAFHFMIYFIFYYLKPNPEPFFSLNPHPLMVGVIGFALFYGNRFGFLATGVSIAMYGGLFYMSYGEWLPLITEWDYFKLPLTFFWMGTTIGLLVANYKNREKTLEENIDIQSRDLNMTRNQYQLSQKALTQLRSQIIDSDKSIIALYDIAKRLQELDEDEILTETVGIISKYLEASQVMIYNYNEGYDHIRLLLGVGVDGVTSENSINIKDKAFYKAVVEQRQVLRFSDGDATDLPLFAGPLIKNNEVIGLVMIKAMSFDFISNYAYTLFKLILDWVNQSLNHVLLVEKQEDKYIIGTELLKYERFKKRLQAERRRYNEYGLRYVFFGVEATENTLIYAKKIQNYVRSIDRVTVIGRKIYVLLPATDLEKNPDIKEKIFSRMDFDLPSIEIGDDF